jgi:6-phosphogluconolactonase (cycloisomerase 2 family)
VFVDVARDANRGDGLNGISAIAISPDGAHIYTTALGADAVVAFSRDIARGTLSIVQVQRDGIGGVDGLGGATHLAVSPDSAHVYVAARFDRAITVFGRDPMTGALLLIETQRDGTGGVEGLRGVGAVAMSPDGVHLYAAGRDDDAIAVFRRDAVTGMLAFVEVQREGVSGVESLDEPFAVTVSPDGGHLYAAARRGNALVVFERNPTTGALTFVEAQQDGAGGVEGLAGAVSVVASPDGLHVYVAGAADDAVAVFARNGATGALTFVEAQQNGVGGVAGLRGAFSVATSPDGAHVYATGLEDDALVVFGRDPTTGELQALQVQRDDVRGVNGLSGAMAAGVSPDGTHVYVVGFDDAAVAVFRTLLVACGSAPEPACLRPAVQEAATLQLRDRSPDARDSIVWKWLQGATVWSEAFGNPRNGITDYVLCVYDESAAPQPVIQMSAPAGSTCGKTRCWRRTVAGFRYGNKKRNHGGIRRMALTEGPIGLSRIVVIGRGRNIGMPRLPLTPKVTVQLKTANGGCWFAEYDVPIVSVPHRFRARSTHRWQSR